MGTLTSLSSVPQYIHRFHACQVLGGHHPEETAYSTDSKQKVSSKEAPSVKHMKGELMGVQDKYWNIAVNLKALFQKPSPTLI